MSAFQCLFPHLVAFGSGRASDMGEHVKDKTVLLVDSAFEVKRLPNNNPKTLSKEDIRGIYKVIFSELASCAC